MQYVAIPVVAILAMFHWFPFFFFATMTGQVGLAPRYSAGPLQQAKQRVGDEYSSLVTMFSFSFCALLFINGRATTKL